MKIMRIIERFTTRNAFLNLAKATPFDIVTQVLNSNVSKISNIDSQNTWTETYPWVKPSDLLPRKKTYPYYYGIREWLTQTMQENNFDGAILSSEMFLYGNGLFVILIGLSIKKESLQIWIKPLESGLIASRISNDTTEEIAGRWDFVKQLQSLYRFKLGIIWLFEQLTT